MKYKWMLMKNAKKTKCPQCGGDKCFVPYVSTKDGKTPAGANFGRCERINSCGYNLYPNSVNDAEIKAIPPKIEPKKPASIVPSEIVEKSFSDFKSNIFFIWLVHMFGNEEAWRLQQLYNIGTAKRGGTIFWQQDKDEKFRTGKVFYYNTDGHRNKELGSWYVHKRVDPNFNLEQVFFGEHLINDEKPIAICESEKSAVIMAHFMPEFTWLASGGSEMLSIHRLTRLPRLDFVYPDNGQFDKWNLKTSMFNRVVDISVDKAVQSGILKKGDDIADLFLLDFKK